jgi:hypothetical protein
MSVFGRSSPKRPRRKDGCITEGMDQIMKPTKLEQGKPESLAAQAFVSQSSPSLLEDCQRGVLGLRLVQLFPNCSSIERRDGMERKNISRQSSTFKAEAAGRYHQQRPSAHLINKLAAIFRYGSLSPSSDP